jgi:hypothetical protein
MGEVDQSTIKSSNSFLDKIFGGLNMSWLTVIIFAIVTAVITAVFLIVPAFKGTSFEMMGVYLEAWILFAVIIMSNCKKPLESALKVFVFFLISQPLIYLIQVPFAEMGWGLFGYYRYWFMLTLGTFPVAFVGWFITKKNWLSAIIFSPIIAYLAFTAYGYGVQCYERFPKMLVATLFCAVQVIVYIAYFFSGRLRKVFGLVVVIAAIVFCVFKTSSVNINSTVFLPEGIVLTEEASIVDSEADGINVSLESTGDDSMIRVQTEQYGSREFTVTDSGKEYRFYLNVYKDDEGVTKVEVQRAD